VPRMRKENRERAVRAGDVLGEIRPDVLLAPRLRCIVCGCTEELPCAGQITETGTCFWTYWNEETLTALCSACAGKTIEELKRCLELAEVSL